jgi:hypothetical protein
MESDYDRALREMPLRSLSHGGDPSPEWLLPVKNTLVSHEFYSSSPSETRGGPWPIDVHGHPIGAPAESAKTIQIWRRPPTWKLDNRDVYLIRFDASGWIPAFYPSDGPDDPTHPEPAPRFDTAKAAYLWLQMLGCTE